MHLLKHVFEEKLCQKTYSGNKQKDHSELEYSLFQSVSGIFLPTKRSDIGLRDMKSLSPQEGDNDQKEERHHHREA